MYIHTVYTDLTTEWWGKNEKILVNHSGRDKHRQLTVSAFPFIKIQEQKKQETNNNIGKND